MSSCPWTQRSPLPVLVAGLLALCAAALSAASAVAQSPPGEAGETASEDLTSVPADESFVDDLGGGPDDDVALGGGAGDLGDGLADPGADAPEKGGVLHLGDGEEVIIDDTYVGPGEWVVHLFRVPPEGDDDAPPGGNESTAGGQTASSTMTAPMPSGMLTLSGPPGERFELWLGLDHQVPEARLAVGTFGTRPVELAVRPEVLLQLGTLPDATFFVFVSDEGHVPAMALHTDEGSVALETL